jgi:chromosome segregation ATPase
MTPAELQDLRERDAAIRIDEHSIQVERDRRALLAYVDQLEAKVAEWRNRMPQAWERDRAILEARAEAAERELESTQRELLARVEAVRKRAEAAKKERDEYRTMWDGLKAQWAGLVKDWEAAEARVRELTEAIQDLDDEDRLTCGAECTEFVDHRLGCPVGKLRAALAKGGG